MSIPNYCVCGSGGSFQFIISLFETNMIIRTTGSPETEWAGQRTDDKLIIQNRFTTLTFFQYRNGDRKQYALGNNRNQAKQNYTSNMLNARIEIDTSKLPYKINRKMPTFLEPYFQERIQWIIFCDNIDVKLEPYEGIKAAWMVIGALFTLVLIGLIAGIVVRFTVIDDEDQKLGNVLSGALFGGLVVSFAVYFCLMQVFVLIPLKKLAQSTEDYCEKVATKWDNVDFKFQRSSKWAIYWDSDFKAWINVVSSDAV